MISPKLSLKLLLYWHFVVGTIAAWQEWRIAHFKGVPILNSSFEFIIKFYNSLLTSSKRLLFTLI